MINRSHIIGLVFFALALCFAISPTDFISSAAAQMELQDGGTGDSGGGGKSAGDPDMPDTQPPPPGSNSLSGGYGTAVGGTGAVSSSPDSGTAIGSGLNADSMWRVWLRTVWRVFRVQFGW